MKCPNCPDSKLTLAERQGIEIDYCPDCRGVWLDRGELDKIIERIGPEVAFGDPGNGLDVAQAAWARFDVGLEVVGRVVGLEVTLVLLAHLRVEEFAYRPDRRWRQSRAHADHQ